MGEVNQLTCMTNSESRFNESEPLNSNPIAIETRGLTRWFGEQCAVDHVDLRVKQGSFFGFLGPNGAGKSTTIKMLTGLLAPSEGGIEILGMNPKDQALDIKRRIGVVPEKLALFDNLTAPEYLMFIGRMFSMERHLIEERTHELLNLLKLAGDAKKLAGDYSHGMRKKLALAAAVLPDPDLLFLDEPFEGVDAVTSRVIREMLGEFCNRGSTVFLTSHVLEIVERLCSDVAIISAGKVVEQSSLSELAGDVSLETRFLEVVGQIDEPVQKLSWLENE